MKKKKNHLRIQAGSAAARDPKFTADQFEFPLRVEVDNAAVTILSSTQRKNDKDYTRFTVQYRDPNRVRRQIERSDFTSALKQAIAVAIGINNGKREQVNLYGDDRENYLAARDMLKPVGVRLDAAIRDYVAARKLLGSHTLTEAAKSFLATRVSVPDITVEQVIDEMINLKKRNEKSTPYVTDLENRLADFAQAHAGPISSVTTESIEAYLSNLKPGERNKNPKLSARSRNNYRSVVGTLLSFAKKRKYLPKEHPGITDVEKAEEKPQEEIVFSAEQMKTLLGRASRTMMLYLLFCGYAGIRHAELLRMTWSEVDLKEGYITVQAAKAKTKMRRLVPISDNLRAWLTPLAAQVGPIIAVNNLSKPIHLLSLKTKVPWHRNALRNSYISYRVSLTNDPQRVAFECGNSPRMIMTNYLRLVTPASAKAYFNVYPTAPANVVPMARVDEVVVS